jgi:hypothetical protein
MTPEEVYERYKKIWSEKKTEFKCDFCDAIFTENNNAYRCHKVRCKKKADKLVMKSYEQQFLKEDERTIEERYEDACKKVEELTKQLHTVTQSAIIGNNNHDNQFNNGPVTNINITINALGKEDLTHLVEDKVFKKKMDATFRHATRCWDALPYLIQNIHFGKESNKNVIVKDPNDKNVYYYNGEEWMVAKKAEVFDRILVDNWK